MSTDKDVNLLIIVPAEGSGEGPYTLLTEKGEGLASHFCSNSNFAKSDLHDRRAERKEEYEKRFGEYEVKFINRVPELTEKELVKLNQEWHKEHTQEEEAEESEGAEEEQTTEDTETSEEE